MTSVTSYDVCSLIARNPVNPPSTSRKILQACKKKKKGPNNKQNFIFVPPVLGDYCEILQFEKTWNNEFVKTKVQRAQVQM